MTEFETQNTVDVVIDDRSLTEARADLESALSEVPVDVTVEASGAGGGEPAARDRARSRQLLTQQTESIDELREEMVESGDASEWQQQFSLSRERNRLLRQLIESTEEGDFDRASRAGGKLLAGGGAALGAGAILGVGALSSVLSSFSWPQLPDLSIPEPPWDPIGVDEPSEVPVENPSEAPVEDPKEQPVQDPREQPVEDPKEQPVEDPKTQPVEDPEPVEVEEPDFKVQVENPSAESSGGSDSSAVGEFSLKELLGGSAVAAAAGGSAYLASEGLRRGGQAAAGGGVAFPTPEAVGATDQEQFNQQRRTFNKRTPDWLRLPEMEGENKYSGSVFTAEGRKAQAEGIQELVSAFNDLREDVQSTQEDTPSTRRTEVTVENNVTVDGATRREVERGFENAKEEALREFDRKFTTGR